MECLLCDESARYHRSVVRVETGDCLGGVCRRCEERAFGKRLDGAAVPRGECLYCSGAGVVVLPEHHIELERVAGVDVESEGYPVTAESPRLCSDHAVAALGGERTASDGLELDAGAIHD